MIFHEVPSPGHPAAHATVRPVVLPEPFFVGGVCCEGTVDELLLRETHWCDLLSSSLMMLLRSGAFEGCQGSEGPAGATVTLVLDGNHIAVGVVVNVGGSVDEMTAS